MNDDPIDKASQLFEGHLSAHARGRNQIGEVVDRALQRLHELLADTPAAERSAASLEQLIVGGANALRRQLHGAGFDKATTAQAVLEYISRAERSWRQPLPDEAWWVAARRAALARQ